MTQADMPFIQNRKEEAFFLCENNIITEITKEIPNHMKELVG
jgi:hypothetical protein